MNLLGVLLSTGGTALCTIQKKPAAVVGKDKLVAAPLAKWLAPALMASVAITSVGLDKSSSKIENSLRGVLLGPTGRAQGCKVGRRWRWERGRLPTTMAPIRAPSASRSLSSAGWPPSRRCSLRPAAYGPRSQRFPGGKSRRCPCSVCSPRCGAAQFIGPLQQVFEVSLCRCGWRSLCFSGLILGCRRPCVAAATQVGP